MKTEKKIEKWLSDGKFEQFASEYITNEMKRRIDAGFCDRAFEEMNEAFDMEDGYIVPIAEYLSYKLHVARLRRKRDTGDREMWKVYYCLQMMGAYGQFQVFEDLRGELWVCMMTAIHRDYVHTLNRQKK